MAKPRNAARALATRFKPRRRQIVELTPKEQAAASDNLWFAMMCLSGKERLVEKAFHLLGLTDTFTALDVHHRRTNIFKRRHQPYEQYTRASLPGYVFAAVPRAVGGLPWPRLLQARDERSPGGMSFLHGYLATGPERRPALISTASIQRQMANSHVPLYLDEESERAFDFDYGAASVDQVFTPGEEIEVVSGLLTGERFPFKAADGLYLVVQGPRGDLKIPASQAIAAE